MEEPIPKNGAARRCYEQTRKSLIEKLGNWEDQRAWDEFYRTYWKLILSVALKAGLRQEEAFDVVQETILALAKQSQQNKYDPEQGSFKVWLMNMARWRIADQFRKRKKDTASRGFSDQNDDRGTATLDRIADPAGNELEQVWDAEWNKNLADRAIAKVKAKVSPKQFQIFDCYVVKGWPVRRVVTELGVSTAQVYLSKHRVGSLIKQEVNSIENSSL
ncbi:MAG: RNA polymerase sigma factor (sigma-70 family) [Verrucomicrobiales bacterium]|jgi:RNA polymerase sigma factor (sigma-70 family)